MGGRNARELAREFGAGRSLNPELTRAVYHVSLSIAPEEKLTPAQWNQVAEKYLDKMGFTANQYTVIRHSDKEHDHIHIIANRVRLDNGKTVTDSNNYARSEAALREIERAHGLNQLRSSHEVERRAPTRGEIEALAQTGEPSIKMRLQDAIAKAAQDKPEMGRFIERLRERGVEVIPNLQSTGRVSGLSYELEGKTMKGSDLGKAYTWTGVQEKLGVSYEHSRDHEAVRSAAERRNSGPAERSRDAPGPDGRDGVRRGLDSGGIPEGERGRAKDGEAAGRAAPGHEKEPGRAAGGTEKPDRERERMREPDRAVTRPGASVPETGGRDQGGLRPEHERRPLVDMGGDDFLLVVGHAGVGGRTAVLPGAERKDDGGHDQGGGGRTPEREQAAASGASKEKHPGGSQEKPAEGGEARSAQDRTASAVRDQIRAYGCERFEIGIRNHGTGRMMGRQWNAAEIEKAVDYLRAMNARGNDVYVRPAEIDGLRCPGVVLLDDLKRDAVAQMKRDGFAPCLVVETSRGNFQAWIRLAERPLEKEVATEAARELAARYQADRNSADWRHFGRLAGYTNQKPERARADGQAPYVKLHEAREKTASNGPELVERARGRVNERAIERERAERLEKIQGYQPPPYGQRERRSPAELYREESRKILQKPPLDGAGRVDYSAVDYRASLRLAEQDLSKSQIKEALREASPKLADRKAGHLEDYLERTVTKALNQVIQERILTWDTEVKSDKGGMDR